MYFRNDRDGLVGYIWCGLLISLMLSLFAVWFADSVFKDNLNRHKSISTYSIDIVDIKEAKENDDDGYLYFYYINDGLQYRFIRSESTGFKNSSNGKTYLEVDTYENKSGLLNFLFGCILQEKVYTFYITDDVPIGGYR